jgi:hypothetical protein
MNDRRADAASAPQPERVQRELLLKLYDSLRGEIAAFLKEIGLLATSAVLASGAAWSWILVHEEAVSGILLFGPFVLAILFGLRAHALEEGIKRASDHLARIEEAFGLDEKLGWDIRWRKELGLTKILADPRKALEFNPLGAWLYIFWISIVVINLMLAGILSVVH